MDQLSERIRCPFCGYRVIMKSRPKAPVTVPAK
jgi:DNA-directed RNA polymerase subunit RPC12/RpoP